jgi:3-methyladenine DNA glycosylase AlkD
MKLLPLIEQAATDDRDFVRKAVSCALAQHRQAQPRAERRGAGVCAQDPRRGQHPCRRPARRRRRHPQRALGELDSDRLRARLQGRESV